MRIYTSNDHPGYWPVGVASVVVANDILEAAEMLKTKLTEMGMRDPGGFTLEGVDINTAGVSVLLGGNY